MADRWYCNLQGREIGPLQLSALVEMSRKGSLHPDDLVRRGEHGIWTSAATVAGLFPSGEGDGSDDLEEVSTLDELSIDIAGSTDETSPGASPPLPTTDPAERDHVGTVSADPDIINDLSELNIEFADSKLRNVPVAQQPDVSRPHSSEVVPTEGWYCETFGQTMGPMSFDDLKRMVDNDELVAKDRVRKGESGAWMAAVSVSDLIPEDDFELAPAVMVPSPDDPSSNADPGREKSVSTTPKTIDPSALQTASPIRSDDTSELEPAQNSQTSPPVQPPVSSDAESTSVAESSSTTDLNKWLDEETAHAKTPQKRPDTEKTAAIAKEDKSSVQADGGKPVAVVPRKAVFRRSKPARPKRSLGDLFAPVIKRGKPLAIIGGGILVAGLLVLLFSTSRLALFSHDKEYYDAYLSLYQEFRSLRDQQASDAEWSSFIERANQQNKTMLDWLETAASPKYPARQFLLFVARDNWPAMVSTARSKPSMDEWRLVTNLQSAHSKIEGSTAPPELPKANLAQ